MGIFIPKFSGKNKGHLKLNKVKGPGGANKELSFEIKYVW